MILILLFSSIIQAHVGCSSPSHSRAMLESPCSGQAFNIELSHQVHEIEDVMSWWGASKAQVAAAKCKATSAPSIREMNEVFAEKSQDRRVNKTVHGVRFQNEPRELVEAFEKLTTKTSLYGSTYNVKESQVNVQNSYQINPSCERVLCAMEKIWGNQLGPKILYMKLKHGFNASELAFDNASRFKVEEIDDVLMALEDLPASLQPLGHNRNQRMVPYTVGQTIYEPDSRTLANSGVLFFDAWREKDPLTRQYTTFHELGHNISNRLSSADVSDEWKNFSGWRQLGDEWESSPSACLISKYGATNPYEDFTEVLSAYRYNPQGLESKCPQKYNYMKERVFGGVEFKTTNQCARATGTQLESIHDLLRNEFATNRYPISTQMVESECVGVFSKYPPLDNELQNCAFRASLKVMPEARLNELLREAGMPVNANSKLSLIESFPTNDQLKASMQTRLTQVNQAMESLVGQYRRELANVSPPAPTTHSWYQTMNRCGYVMVEVPEGAQRCFVETLYEEDRAMKEWGAGFLPTLTPPAIFSDRGRTFLKGQDRQLLEDSLSQNPQFIAQFNRARTDFKANLLSSVREMKYTFESNLQENWRSLPAVEFCAQAYSKSNLFLNSWGFQNGQSVQAIEAECVRLQTRPQRFHPRDQDWQAWINNRWK